MQCEKIGCHIITLTDDVLKKLPSIGKDLDEFSLDTVKMFYNDAVQAGYQLETNSAFVPEQSAVISFAPPVTQIP